MIQRIPVISNVTDLGVNLTPNTHTTNAPKIMFYGIMLLSHVESYVESYVGIVLLCYVTKEYNKWIK